MEEIYSKNNKFLTKIELFLEIVYFCVILMGKKGKIVLNFK